MYLHNEVSWFNERSGINYLHAITSISSYFSHLHFLKWLCHLGKGQLIREFHDDGRSTSGHSALWGDARAAS